FAACERLGAGQDFDQRRFSRAINSYQRHTIAAFDDEIRIREHLVIAIALGNVLEFGHNAAARLGLRESEMNGLFIRRNFNPLDLLQLLDAALHLLGLGSLIAEATDECLQLLDALLLVVVGGLELRQAVGFLSLVACVAAGEKSNALVPQLG